MHDIASAEYGNNDVLLILMHTTNDFQVSETVMKGRLG